MLVRFFGYYRKNQVLARFSTFRTFRTFRPCPTLLAILATLKFSRTNPRRPYDRGPKALRPWPEGLTTVAPKAFRGLAHYYHRFTHDPTHYPKHDHPEHYPGHHPRERIGRIDRIWGLILGGVSGPSPIAFPSVLVDHEH